MSGVEGAMALVARAVVGAPANATQHEEPVTDGRSRDSSASATADAGDRPFLSLRARLPQHAVDELVELSTKSKAISFRRVPATKTARAASFGSLVMRVGWDKLVSSESGLLPTSSHQMVVDTLCRMRGSVLKLGQMLSIQDGETVPSHVTALFEAVRDQAFAMPASQLHATLAKELNDPAWRTTLFERFDEVPIAAASIGQVHRGAMRLEDGHVREVAVKVQYPGVAQSIDSDVGLLKMLMTTSLLPSGMFVDRIMAELRHELSQECCYTIEATKQMRYRELLARDAKLSEFFYVPAVYQQHCTDKIIVSEYVRGCSIEKVASTASVPQEIKNYIAEQLMRLTLTELFEWNFMQTDPNFSNFLFDVELQRVNLLDFGAARDYDRDFVRTYLDVVAAAGRADRDVIIQKSIELGFLTGSEGKEMLDAHVASVCVLGKAFQHRDKPFNFAEEHLPSQVQRHVPTMIQMRLRPPPTPIYSLHRRISGTILICTRLGATIDSGRMFWEIHDRIRKEHAE